MTTQAKGPINIQGIADVPFRLKGQWDKLRKKPRPYVSYFPHSRFGLVSNVGTASRERGDTMKCLGCRLGFADREDARTHYCQYEPLFREFTGRHAVAKPPPRPSVRHPSSHSPSLLGSGSASMPQVVYEIATPEEWVKWINSLMTEIDSLTARNSALVSRIQQLEEQLAGKQMQEMNRVTLNEKQSRLFARFKRS